MWHLWLADDRLLVKRQKHLNVHDLELVVYHHYAAFFGIWLHTLMLKLRLIHE